MLPHKQRTDGEDLGRVGLNAYVAFCLALFHSDKRYFLTDPPPTQQKARAGKGSGFAGWLGWQSTLLTFSAPMNAKEILHRSSRAEVDNHLYADTP